MGRGESGWVGGVKSFPEGGRRLSNYPTQNIEYITLKRVVI